MDYEPPGAKASEPVPGWGHLGDIHVTTHQH